MGREEKSQKSNRKEFGNYIIGKTLGEGTFGKVKLGIHKGTGQNVAIKILQKSKISDLADTERVLRQIHILKLIRHPFIVQLYEIIETPKKLFLITEYMENGELFDYIVKKQRIQQAQAKKLFHQLLDGVQYIHKIGVVHRDLKPQNILLDYKNSLRIVDFGLSNTYKKKDMLKTPCGSPCYAAPQMLKGEQYQPIKVDIWSCGVILFAMLCGYLPFEDNENTNDLYAKILDGEYQVHNKVSEKARDLISKILEVDPEKRLSIDEIREHEWMRVENKVTKGIIVGYNKILIDNNILNAMKEYNEDIEYTKKSLQANRHNNTTTTYYLCMKKFIKEGGKSEYDLTNPEFDEQLLVPNRRREQSMGYLHKTEQECKKSKVFIKSNVHNNSVHNLSMIENGKKVRRKRVQSKIDNSINYGRSTMNKSKQKQNMNMHYENRFTRKYKQKFNQSLVSRSKDKINTKSRVNSSVHKKKHNETQIINHNSSNNNRETIHSNYRRNLSKKLKGAQNSSKIVVIKARKL